MDFQEYYTRRKVYNTATVRSWIKKLLPLLPFIKKHSDVFKSKYSGELLRIHMVLAGRIAKYYFSKNDIDQIRVVHDKLFSELSITNPAQHFKYLPTKLFTEFVKGITYFANEPTDEVPIYHRDESCGSKRLTLKEKHEMLVSNNVSTIKRKKANVRRCYIERLIYDSIYSNTFFEQDIGHCHELQETERLYQDYFKTKHIKIDISYVRTVVPVKLKIYTQKGADLRLEEYTKLQDMVSCSLIENNKTFTKMQSFQEETSWLLE